MAESRGRSSDRTLFFGHCHCDFFGRDGQFVETGADGVADGVRDGGKRRVDDHFADGFRTKRAVGLIAVLELDRILPTSTRVGILYCMSEFSMGQPRWS